MNNWALAGIWNKALENKKVFAAKARDVVWASELGKSPIDVYLRMIGTEATNPPNARSLRKFEAGNVFEWIVSLILKRAGILQESQKWSSFQYPGLCKVTGKADFIAGGLVDREKALAEMSALELPEVFIRGATAIFEYLTSLGELKSMPLEIKSVSSFMFDAFSKTSGGSRIHRLQLYHYLKSMDYGEGRLIYICRDDLRMMEVPLMCPSTVEDEYRSAIEEISKYYHTQERPPVEKSIIFDPDTQRFAKNFNVAYSGYLTMLYGFKDQLEFDNKYSPIVGRWNRVMGRVAAKDKITDKNKAVLEEIKGAGFDIGNLASKFATDEEDDNINS